MPTSAIICDSLEETESNLRSIRDSSPVSSSCGDIKTEKKFINDFNEEKEVKEHNSRNGGPVVAKITLNDGDQNILTSIEDHSSNITANKVESLRNTNNSDRTHNATTTIPDESAIPIPKSDSNAVENGLKLSSDPPPKIVGAMEKTGKFVSVSQKAEPSFPKEKNSKLSLLGKLPLIVTKPPPSPKTNKGSKISDSNSPETLNFPNLELNEIASSMPLQFYHATTTVSSVSSTSSNLIDKSESPEPKPEDAAQDPCDSNEDTPRCPSSASISSVSTIRTSNSSISDVSSLKSSAPSSTNSSPTGSPRLSPTPSTITCNVHYLNDIDPFTFASSFLQPPLAMQFTFATDRPLADHLPGLLRMLDAPQNVSSKPVFVRC